MSNLQYLGIHDNKITGELSNSICLISTLQILILRNNSLQGSIPDCIFNLTSLQILDLSINHLVGKIPTNLGNLTGMIETPGEIFSGFGNMETAYLGRLETRVLIMLGNWNKPKRVMSFKTNYLIVNWKKSIQGLSFYNLKGYSLLDLSMNQLSSEIPSSLGSLKALKIFNISHNNLFGRIPANLGDLENLESLDLSHNNLSGSIPQSIANLLQLTTLDVSNNKLKGKIPEGSQMDTMNDPNSYANNSGLCGMQIQVPCSEHLLPTKPPEFKSKETWFSWEGVGIGYAVGFFVAVGISYLSNPYKTFNYCSQQRRRRV